MTIEIFTFSLNVLASAAFAMTAVLAVSDKKPDLIGAIVLGTLTAVGGGTVRDLILDVPIFWLQGTAEIRAAVIASILVFYARSFFTVPQMFKMLLYLDAFGAALFSMQGAIKTWEIGTALPIAPVIFGVMSAVGGGIIRDTVAGRETLLIKSELYAGPILLGCLIFWGVLSWLPQHVISGAVVCATFIFLFLSAAIHWQWQMPKIFLMHR